MPQEPPYDPYLGIIYEIDLGSQGMQAHENRWLNQPGNLLDAQNLTFENDQLQKEPASAHYDTHGIAVESPNGTFSANTDSTFAALWLPASSAAAFGAQIASSVATTTSPWTVAIGTTAAAGVLVAVAVGQRTHPTDAPMLSSLTDTQGNVYTRQKTTIGSGAIASDVELWTSILTTPVVGGVDTFTLTFATAGSDDRACCAASFTGVTSATSEAAAAAAFDNVATFSSSSNAYVGRSFPALLVGAVHWPAINTLTATWAGGMTQRATASSGAVPSQLSMASKLVPFSTAIVAQIDWKADAESTPAGTVSTTTNSNVVTGVGTSFTTDYFPGDEIIIAGETQIVDQVNSNTSLTTVGSWVTTSAGVAYKRRSGPRVITAALSGKIYKDRPDQGGNTGHLDFQTIQTGFTTSRHRGRFVIGGKENSGQLRKLFYFNGVDPVTYLSGDGSSMSALSAYPADWSATQDAGKQPVNGIVHANALFGWGNLNDPHRIYRSQTADQTKFTNVNPTDDAGQYPIASSIGERLWGGAEYQGVLWLWKYPRGIFYFDDTDPNFLNWTYHIRSEAVGCAPSPYAVLPIDDDVLFCNSDGHFHLLSAVSSLGGSRSSDLTRTLGLHTWMRNNINTTALDQLTSAWDPATKIASFGCRSKNAATPDNDTILRFDFGLKDRGGPVRFSYSTLYAPNSLCIKRRNYTDRPALLIGETSTSFFVDPFNYGYRSIFGVTTGFAHSFTTPQDDFAAQDAKNRYRRKNYDFLEMILSGPDVAIPTFGLTATIYIDTIQRQQFPIVGSGRRFMYPLNVGDGYEFQVKVTSPSSSVADIRSIGFTVGWRPGSMDHSRQS